MTREWPRRRSRAVGGVLSFLHSFPFGTQAALHVLLVPACGAFSSGDHELKKRAFCGCYWRCMERSCSPI